MLARGLAAAPQGLTGNAGGEREQERRAARSPTYMRARYFWAEVPRAHPALGPTGARDEVLSVRRAGNLTARLRPYLAYYTYGADKCRATVVLSHA